VFCGTHGLTMLSIVSITNLLLLWGSQFGDYYVYIVMACITAQVALWERWTGMEVLGSQMLGFFGSAVVFFHGAWKLNGGSLVQGLGQSLMGDSWFMSRATAGLCAAMSLAGLGIYASVCWLRWARTAPVYTSGARPWGMLSYFGSLSALSFAYSTGSTLYVLLGAMVGGVLTWLSDQSAQEGEELYLHGTMLVWIMWTGLAQWGYRLFKIMKGTSPALAIVIFLATTSYLTWMYGGVARKKPAWFIKGA